jgi:hypothetical protein
MSDLFKSYDIKIEVIPKNKSILVTQAGDSAQTGPLIPQQSSPPIPR